MKFTLLICAIVAAASLSDARLTIRHRRQVEREGSSSESSSSSDVPASEVVVIKDTINPTLPGPLFLVPRLPGRGDAFDLDINEQDGTFTFGGLLPPHLHHHHGGMQPQSFAGLFDAIQRRFDEMTRNMMSFNSFGPGFNPMTDISSLPDNFNKTDSEIVEMNGHRYVKKTTTLKKGGPGATFFVRSTTYERVNENENADIPQPSSGAGEAEEENKKDKPIGTDEQSRPPVEESDKSGAPEVSPSPSSSDPKDGPAREENDTDYQPGNGSTPDTAPASSSSEPSPAASESEGPAIAAAAGEEDESKEESSEREREGDPLPSSSTSTTESS